MPRCLHGDLLRKPRMLAAFALLAVGRWSLSFRRRGEALRLIGSPYFLPIAAVLLFAPLASWAQSCASATGQWQTSGGGQISLTQTGSVIQGTLSPENPICPSWTYIRTAGAFLGNGSFTVTFQWGDAWGGRPVQCPKTISYTGAIQKPGCNKATIGWQSEFPQNSGQFYAQQSCRLPSETTPQFVQWGGVGYQDTQAAFVQSYTPTDYNWGGRTVSESFPQLGYDSCWFYGSDYPAFVQGIPHAPTTLTGAVPTGSRDTIGMSPAVVNFYRRRGKTPCGFTVYQTMSIDCAAPQGTTAFKTHPLFLGAEYMTVTSGRAGIEASRIWGTPAIELLMSPILYPMWD